MTVAPLGGLNSPGEPKFIHDGWCIEAFLTSWTVRYVENAFPASFPSASSVSNNGSPPENLNTNSCCSLDRVADLGIILFLGDKNIPGLLVNVNKALASTMLLLAELPLWLLLL